MAKVQADYSEAQQARLAEQQYRTQMAKARQQEQQALAQARAAQSKGRRQGPVSAPELGRSHVFVKPSGTPRIIDGILGLAGSGAGALWTATRATEGQRLAWGLGQVLLGGVIGIEAAGTEVGSFFGGDAAGNAAFLLLSLVHPNLSK